METQINKYLSELEIWLLKWKMKIAANKCNYMIFTQNKTNIPKFKLHINNDLIPYTDHIKFLGLIFDNRLNFNLHINEIRTKCLDRLKIIKILSHKSWKLSPSTLMNIYKSLLGSIIDYAFMCLHLISETDLRRLQAIQNNAIRCIFRLPYDCSREELVPYEQGLGLNSVAERLDCLNERYITKCIANSNSLFAKLIADYVGGFSARIENHSTPLSLYYLLWAHPSGEPTSFSNLNITTPL